jgi:hypothetical protein
LTLSVNQQMQVRRDAYDSAYDKKIGKNINALRLRLNELVVEEKKIKNTQQDSMKFMGGKNAYKSQTKLELVQEQIRQVNLRIYHLQNEL